MPIDRAEGASDRPRTGGPPPADGPSQPGGPSRPGPPHGHGTDERLRTVHIEPLGRFADASNATLLVRLLDGDTPTLDELVGELGREPTLDDLDPEHLAVYKPRRGEAPLWDFPQGTLHRREVAAYEVSEALGWDLVPVTVLRDDGPFGPGSVQRFVAHDPSLHYFRLLEVGSEGVLATLRRMVVFDLVIDNADRKGGHVLLEGVDDPDRVDDLGSVDEPRGVDDLRAVDDGTLDGEVTGVPVPEEPLDGRIQLVDHGVSFNVERKLRTVAWEFAGEPLDDDVLGDLAGLQTALEGPLGDRFAELLSPEEVAVLLSRVEALREIAVLPEPWGPRAYPWPPL